MGKLNDLTKVMLLAMKSLKHPVPQPPHLENGIDNTYFMDILVRMNPCQTSRMCLPPKAGRGKTTGPRLGLLPINTRPQPSHP